MLSKYQLSIKSSVPDIPNIYRGRELLLRKAHEIVNIIGRAKELEGRQKEDYCEEHANRIVEELNFPYYWRRVLARSFFEGKLLPPREDLDYTIDLKRNEIIVRINKYTTREDLLRVWDEGIRWRNRKKNSFESTKGESLGISQSVLKKTHKPRKISHRDFNFTFIDMYKEETERLKTYIEEFYKLDESKEGEVGYDEVAIRMGISKTRKMLNL